MDLNFGFLFDSIFKKIFFTFLIITIISTLVLGYFSYSRFKEELLDEAKNQLRILARIVGADIYSVIRDSLDDQDIEQLDVNMLIFMNATEIREIIATSQKEGMNELDLGGNSYLLDSNGELIFHAKAEKEKEISYKDTEFFQKIIENKKIKTTYEKFGVGSPKISSSGYINYVREGEEYIGAYAVVNVLDWVLIVDAKRNEIFLPAKEMSSLMLLVGLGILIIAIIGAALSAKLISTPINRAVDFAEEIASGNLRTDDLDVCTQDEVGLLADNLNKMRYNLLERITNIKNLLNNAGQGFLSFCSNLLINAEYSLECENIFNTDISNENFVDLVFKDDNKEELKSKLEIIFNLIEAKKIEKAERRINLFPHHVELNNKHITLEYKIVKNQLSSGFQDRIMIIITDITEKKKITQQAITDGLTGLYNHSYFRKKLVQKIEEAEKIGERFSLLMLDIDNFKRFNDDYGHQAGDAVLKELAKTLESNVRKEDIVARYGGEEFTIILATREKDNLNKQAERIRKNVAQEVIIYNDLKLQVTVSIGAVIYCRGNNSKELVELADKALYSAKRAGRNNVKLNQKVKNKY
jgi:diguanylate cyclase (GGDEF)-like protein